MNRLIVSTWEADHLPDAPPLLDLIEPLLESGEGQRAVEHRQHGAARHQRDRFLQVDERGT